MNKDQVKGRVKNVKGRVKEIVGSTVGNRELESKGRSQAVAGKVQAGYGDVKDDLSGLKRDVKKGMRT